MTTPDPQPSLFRTPLDSEVCVVALERIEPTSARTLIPSVRLMGVLQPVLLKPSDGPYDFAVVDGSRREHSARHYGLTELPALITDGTPAQLAAARAVLNTSRGPNPVQEARAWQDALASGVYPGVEELCRDLGVKVQTVRQRLRLIQLPEALLDGVLAGTISEGVAAKVANLDPLYRQRAVARYAKLAGAGKPFTEHDLKEVRARREGDLTRTVLGSLSGLPGLQPLLTVDPLTQLAADVRRMAQERGVALEELAQALGWNRVGEAQPSVAAPTVQPTPSEEAHPIPAPPAPASQPRRVNLTAR